MPGKILGGADLAAATDTLLYTVGTGKECTFNVSLCNRTTGNAKVRVAIGSGSNPANTDYIEYDAVVPGGGVLERGGIVADAGQKVWVRSDVVGVTARAWGFEETV